MQTKTLAKKIKENAITISLEVFALFILVFLMAFFWQHNTALTILFIGIFFTVLPFLKEKSDIFLFLIATLFFQIGEIIMAKSGAWTYQNPTYLGIPIWISLSWGYSALIIKKLSQSISKVFD